MGRHPGHDTIQVVLNKDMADRIEQMLSPNFTLALLPEEAQTEDDLPVYIFALTEAGMAAMKART